MTYSKPEIAVLGDATAMILGDKNVAQEIADPRQLLASSFELED